MKGFKLIFITLTLLLATSFVSELFGAGPPGPPSGGPGGGGPPCWPPPCVPIDGGLSFLIAAGAIYGGKKIYDISKKS
ncbi:MAG: hypothetical protein CVT95_05765 [Bacteroidetes bacterium HGW-Bacteroidetes-12]|nr:MAG: hypothetical protein CVT95_05765 [Bacteroidetes bacterium HGW-Bacteroidetes-12]